ncbi:hypothetical protein [Streptosporangium sp. NPDC002721]|uniref:hypothetical protein n=1 Tax=Streptosporangium sp. NPDC002721 TaxID=3366188 RepID=UPI0036C3606C
MESFLSGLGGKIAEKWLTTLVLPGLLFAGAVLVAFALPHEHALDVHLLLARTRAATAELGRSGAASVILVVVMTLTAASAAALAARGCGSLVQWLWLRQWRGPLARRLVERRRARWTAADDALADHLAETRDDPARRDDPVRRDELAAVRNGISLAYPARPVWIADRARSVDIRVWHAHGIDLGSAWPRLWLVVPDSTRTEIVAARETFERAGGLVGWGLLYTALGAIWWPSAVAGLATALTGWHRTRAAVAGYADLVEAAADLNAKVLATELDLLEPGAPFSRDVGLKVTRLLRKGT